MNSLYNRSNWGWSVLDELLDMQGDLNNMFQLVGQGRRHDLFPPVNAWISDNNVVLETEVPGVAPENIDIAVEGQTVRISGKRDPEEGKDIIYHRKERPFGAFHREIEIPYGVEADKVAAVFSNGVLRIELPRKESEKPRKIAIKAA